MPDKINTEMQILTTAIELFGKYGKHGVSTAEIADKAGVNKALIFYYFSSKDGLYRSAFKHLVEEFFKTVHPKISVHESGLKTVEIFIREHIAFLKKHREMVKFMVRELLTADQKISEDLRDGMEVMKTLRDDLLKALSLARSKGEIRDVDPLQTFVNIISLNIFFFLGKPLARLVSESIDAESFEEERVEHVLDLILNGLRKHTE